MGCQRDSVSAFRVRAGVVTSSPQALPSSVRSAANFLWEGFNEKRRSAYALLFPPPRLNKPKLGVFLIAGNGETDVENPQDGEDSVFFLRGEERVRFRQGCRSRAHVGKVWISELRRPAVTLPVPRSLFLGTTSKHRG